MQALGFYILYPLLKFFSLLPWPLIYFHSDVLYIKVYYIFRYRRKVVRTNLKNAFPEKSEAEITAITKQFYHHFCDTILEMIKLLSASHASIQKRCVLDPKAKELTQKYFSEKKNIIWIMGHTGNWEMAGASFAGIEGYRLNVLYKPLSNPYFDKLMFRIRSRFGTYPISVNDTYRELIKAKDILTGTVFIGDQTPPPESAHWTRFLNQDTPIYKGTEVLAKKLDYVVIYAYISKEKRGSYTMHMELISEHPSQTPDNQLTEIHTRLLERDIRNTPYNWLWSHRRWKHKRPE